MLVQQHLWPSFMQAHRPTVDLADLLLQEIIARLLALARAEDKGVRLRTCQLLQLIINNQVIGFRPQGNLTATQSNSGMQSPNRPRGACCPVSSLGRHKGGLQQDAHVVC